MRQTVYRKFTASIFAALLLLVGSACATKKQSVPEDATAEQLYNEGVAKLSHRQRILGVDVTDYDGAIESFQNVIDHFPYSEQAVLAELKIADTYFADKKYDQAVSYYRDFADLHPQHSEVPYTIYQSALCYYNQSKEFERDQTASRSAIEHFETLMRRYPQSEYAKQGEPKWKELQLRLAKRELMIGNYYFARAEYSSALQRFQALLDGYPGLGLDAEALYKLGLCYTKMKRPTEAARAFDLLKKNYPESKFSSLSSKVTTGLEN